MLNDLIAYPDCIAFEAEIEEICRILHLTLNISSTTMVTNISENKKTPLNVLNRIGKLKRLFLFQNLSDQTLELVAKGMSKKKYSKETL